MPAGIFDELSLSGKFKLLYHAVSANRDWLIQWIKEDFVSLGSVEGGMDGLMSDQFDFMKTTILPELNESYIKENHEEFIGIAENTHLFIEWLEDNGETPNVNRAYAIGESQYSLFSLIADHFESVEEEDDEEYEDEDEFEADENEGGTEFDTDSAAMVLAYAFLGSGLIPEENVSGEMDILVADGFIQWEKWTKGMAEKGFGDILDTWLKELSAKSK